MMPLPPQSVCPSPGLAHIFVDDTPMSTPVLALESGFAGTPDGSAAEGIRGQETDIREHGRRVG
jgi:hypothetical protein